MSDPFDGVIVADDHNRPIALSAFADEAQRAAAERPAEAAALFMRAIEQVLTFGLPAVADALLDMLERAIPFSNLPRDSMAAWILNARGRAEGGLGRTPSAIKAYRGMRAIGEEVGDADVIATADMNLGVQAFLDGDFPLARQLQEASLEIKRQVGDRYAVAQLELNLALIAMEEDRLDDAERLLAAAQKSTRRGDAARLRAGLAHQQGLLATKRGEIGLAQRRFRQALRAAVKTDNIQGIVHACQSLGAASLDLGQVEDAIRWYESGLQFAAAAELASSQAALRQGLATAFHRAGDDGKAKAQLEGLRVLAERTGDRLAWAKATADLGAMAVAEHSFDQALDALAAAAAVFRESGDQDWLVRVLRNLLEAHRGAGNAAMALECVREALAILPKPARADRADLLRRAAWAALAEQGALEQAVALFNESLLEIGDDAPSAAWSSVQAAAALSESGGKQAALPFYERAIRIYGELGDQHLLAQTRNDRGNALTAIGRFDEARIDFLDCLVIAERLKDRVIELQAQLNLGELARRAGFLSEAIARLQRAAELATQLDDHEGVGLARGNLGLALANDGQWDRAQDVFERLLRDSAEQPLVMSIALGGMAQLAFRQKDYARAADLYRQAASLPLNGAQRIHVVEDLGGWLQSSSALGDAPAAQDAAQQIVSLVAQIGANGVAADSLIQAASQWLAHGRDEIAVELARAAIIVAASDSPIDDETLAETLRATLLQLLVSIHDIEESDDRVASICDRLVAAIAATDGDFAAFIRALLDIALQSNAFR